MPGSDDLPAEIESLDQLEKHLARGEPLSGCVFQDLDLTPYADAFLGASLERTIFLGCLLDPRVLAHAQAEGALIFPRIGDLPYDPYRGTCYTVDELYAGYAPGVPGSYAGTLDGRIYEHYRRMEDHGRPELREALARRLHDHSITDALDELLVGQRIVGFMGGHGLSRTAPEFQAVAEAARALRRKGFLIVTGGGPGAMEAAHLGAWFAPRPDGELVEALAILTEAPLYTPIEGWLDAGFEVRRRYPLTGVAEPWSVGVPTWMYGHEPPNVFATRVAKYFANSLREDGLVTIAASGMVFAPGSAGTIQEIFQDVTQNHYEMFGGPSPMIFFGQAYWTLETPVFPLLMQLAKGRPYSRWIAVTDDPAEVVALIEEYVGSRSPEA
jgi:predicted Rossmann-fold nucleotide-binding protein